MSQNQVQRSPARWTWRPRYQSSSPRSPLWRFSHPSTSAHQRRRVNENNLAEKSETHATLVSCALHKSEAFFCILYPLPFLQKKQGQIIFAFCISHPTKSFSGVKGTFLTACRFSRPQTLALCLLAAPLVCKVYSSKNEILYNYLELFFILTKKSCAKASREGQSGIRIYCMNDVLYGKVLDFSVKHRYCRNWNTQLGGESSQTISWISLQSTFCSNIVILAHCRVSTFGSVRHSLTFLEFMKPTP